MHDTIRDDARRPGHELRLRWTWADPLAALILVPIIAREGFEAMGLGGSDEED